MLDKDEVMSVSRAFADEVRKTFSPDKVLLFGSYAKGNAREESDIDIAVVIYGYNGNWHDDEIRLLTLCEKLKERGRFYIEPHLISEEDNVSGFYDEVMKTGIELI